MDKNSSYLQHVASPLLSVLDVIVGLLSAQKAARDGEAMPEAEE